MEHPQIHTLDLHWTTLEGPGSCSPKMHPLCLLHVECKTTSDPSKCQCHTSLRTREVIRLARDCVRTRCLACLLPGALGDGRCSRNCNSSSVFQSCAWTNLTMYFSQDCLDRLGMIKASHVHTQEQLVRALKLFSATGYQDRT